MSIQDRNSNIYMLLLQYEVIFEYLNDISNLNSVFTSIRRSSDIDWWNSFKFIYSDKNIFSFSVVYCLFLVLWDGRWVHCKNRRWYLYNELPYLLIIKMDILFLHDIYTKRIDWTFKKTFTNNTKVISSHVFHYKYHIRLGLSSFVPLWHRLSHHINIICHDYLWQ